MELEGFGDELGECQVADGPVDVVEEGNDFGEVGGSDEGGWRRGRRGRWRLG